MSLDIIICGVGGQGTLLTSRIIGAMALAEGLDVKLSEVHGMSQRGGSVVTYVRLGEKIDSPLIEAGSADILLAFEELEALRYLPYLKENGTLIVNKQQMLPMPVITGAASYPEDAIERIKSKCKNVIVVDALELAGQAGSAKAVNVVLLGVMAKVTEFHRDKWIEAVRAKVPAKTVDVNIKAFEYGLSAAV